MKERTLLILVAMSFFTFGMAQPFSEQSDKPWKLSLQAFSLRAYSLEETLAKMDSLGLKYIEIYPGQWLDSDKTQRVNHRLDESQRNRMKAWFKQYGITPVAYGVVYPEARAEWDTVFNFAADLGIKMIVTEPHMDDVPIIDSLCQVYGIRAALHNHALPNSFWHPATAESLLNGRSSMIGICADVGHWVRSDIDVISWLARLDDRVIGIHLKDLNQSREKQAHDVPWGTGVCDIAGILRQLNQQSFSGYVTIEYNYRPEDNLDEIAESIAYYQRVLSRM